MEKPAGRRLPPRIPQFGGNLLDVIPLDRVRAAQLSAPRKCGDAPRGQRVRQAVTALESPSPPLAPQARLENMNIFPIR